MPDVDLEAPIKLILWRVAPGDSVLAGDCLAEVLAGEVLIEICSEFSGVLADRHVREEQPVTPGQQLATIDTP